MNQTPAKVARVAIYQSDAEGRCIYVNAALCEMFGLSEKQALGIGWLDKIHPDDRERVSGARKFAVTAIPVFHIEYRIQVEGKTRWIAAFSTALMEGGKFKGRIGTITDITDAKTHYLENETGSG